MNYHRFEQLFVAEISWRCPFILLNLLGRGWSRRSTRAQPPLDPADPAEWWCRCAPGTAPSPTTLQLETFYCNSRFSSDLRFLIPVLLKNHIGFKGVKNFLDYCYWIKSNVQMSHLCQKKWKKMHSWAHATIVAPILTKSKWIYISVPIQTPGLASPRIVPDFWSFSFLNSPSQGWLVTKFSKMATEPVLANWTVYSRLGSRLSGSSLTLTLASVCKQRIQIAWF